MIIVHRDHRDERSERNGKLTLIWEFHKKSYKYIEY